ncbi:glycerol-3-phosphate cytidylyltransferase [Luteimonas sp. SDU82]|uniref:glycerol-3-phosphate cytidylyltransferase n=1 Tax=Luteimonas sp. SDU82 TaxID=3422592 RepID=UPI003EB8A827
MLTYGTFDILHVGHINLLRRARALGDRLVVGLSTDEFNEGKHKSSLLNYENRKAVLEAIRHVDEVFPERTWEQKVDDIRRLGAHVFVMGEDWCGKFDFLSEYCEVVYLPRTAAISTTEIKQSFGQIQDVDACGPRILGTKSGA